MYSRSQSNACARLVIMLFYALCSMSGVCVCVSLLEDWRIEERTLIHLGETQWRAPDDVYIRGQSQPKRSERCVDRKLTILIGQKK